MTQRFKITIIPTWLAFISNLKIFFLLCAAFLAYYGQGEAAIVVSIVTFAMFMAEVIELVTNTVEFTPKKQAQLFKKLVHDMSEDGQIGLAMECMSLVADSKYEQDHNWPTLIVGFTHEVELVHKKTGETKKESVPMTILCCPRESVKEVLSDMVKDDMMAATGITEEQLEEMFAVAKEHGTGMFGIAKDDNKVVPLDPEKRKKPTKH